jgi:hypothetical protein
MLHVKYYIKKKYISIILYHKKYGILFNHVFFKNTFNWVYNKNYITEFLFEVGLIKFKK